MSEVRIVKVADTPEMDVPGHTFCTGREIAGKSLGISAYALKSGTFGKGGTSIEHVHEESEHVFYILSGAMMIFASGKEYTAKAGEALYIPAGIPHASANVYDGETSYIALTIPPA